MIRSSSALCLRGTGHSVLAFIALISSSVCFEATSIAQDKVKIREEEPSRTEIMRVSTGLLALYDFSSAEKDWIRDASGKKPSLDLKIENPGTVRQSGGVLEIRGNARIRSERPATKIATAVQKSGELTIEAWMQPANTKQTGPARIVSLSKDSSNRNATLGQDGNRFDVRLRSQSTSTNGLPSTTSSSKAATQKLTHVVYTRDRRGKARIYVNGRENTSRDLKGAFSNWDRGYHLALADEMTGGRAWRGKLFLVAIYGRSLTANQVRTNFRAGAAGRSAIESETSRYDLFLSEIAPILSDHCIECHDAVNKEGGLDLSHKSAALIGGDSGKVIESNRPDESLLVQTILDDEMPLDRTPLSKEQKQLLVDWVKQGADWSMDFVDPALFIHSGRTSERYVQRLTVDEYVATVMTTMGVNIESEAKDLLPKDLRADGFSNTAYNLNVDLKHIEAYRTLSEKIVSKLDVDAFVRRFSKRKKFTDKDVGALIETMGEWVLRGPLEPSEVIAYRGISTSVASAGGGFDKAASLILEAMLQSPRFIYRIENQVGDGTEWPVNEYELASRVSYILWGSSPDQELFSAAKRGDLFDPEKLETHVERMLKDPRADERARSFVTEWLNLSGLSNLNPSSERFPKWNPELAQDMKAETLAFFNRVALEQNRPLSDLLSAQVTFVTPALADHYNLAGSPKKSSRSSSTLDEYDLSSDSARGGILTQGSVLTKGGDDASMVTRGLFVLHDLLRGVVKDPPPCVDTTPVPTEPGKTQRSIATSRIKNEACGGCHSKFEPLAFGLERFDGLGTYHVTDEHSNPLREDGEIIIPGAAEAIEYTSAKQLMKVLAESERVKESFTWKLTQFALGRPLSAADATSLEKIHRTAAKERGTYQSTMKAIVLSDLVLMSPTEDQH